MEKSVARGGHDARMRIFRLGCVAGALLLTSPPVLAAEAGAWRAVPLPFLWRDSGLRAVAATGPGDVRVAGYQGYKVLPHPVNVVSHGSPVVRRWDGAAWRGYPLNGWDGPGWAPRLAAGSSRGLDQHRVVGRAARLPGAVRRDGVPTRRAAAGQGAGGARRGPGRGLAEERQARRRARRVGAVPARR
ncbi:hypothetical protein GCM10009678_78150 [Actinomadura kijaniata]